MQDNGIMDEVNDPDVLWRDLWYFSDRQVSAESSSGGGVRTSTGVEVCKQSEI